MNRRYKSYLFVLLGLSVLELACTSSRTDKKGGKCYVRVHVENVSATTYAKVAWLHEDSNLFDIEELDSIPVINGLFSFECTIKRLTSASIRINDNYMRIYLEPGEIDVNLDGSAPYLVSQSGTSVDKELDAVNNYLLENSKRAINRYFNQFSGLVNKIDHPDAYIFGEREHRETNKQRKEMLLSFSRSHMNYRIIPDLLHQVLLLDDDNFHYAHQIENIYKDLPSSAKYSDFHAMLGWEIRQVLRSLAARNKVSAEAPDIQFKTTDGKQFRLYSYLDESFVLLHFGGDVRNESQKLSYYYNIPKLKIISITQNCMPKDEKAFSQFVQGRWPLSMSIYDFSYYGMRLLPPATLYDSFASHKCILISPNRTIIGRWEGENMPSGEEIKRVIDES